jgi:ubiquinone/menaquinone biosynthesis C-methylase UbiE
MVISGHLHTASSIFPRNEGPDMDLKTLRAQWERLARIDPMRAILVRSDQPEEWKWDAGKFFETGKREIEEVLAHLGKLGLSIPSVRALDFGCGVGRLTQALARHFDEVDGVDISATMLKVANQFNSAENCRYTLNSVEDLKLFESESFDFVYSSIVLQHMKPVYALKYMAEFLRILRSGGVLVFQMPSQLREGEREAPFKMRRLASEIAPVWLRETYRRGRRFLRRKPIIEMYCVRREEIVRHLEKHGGSVLDSCENKDAPSYISLRYYVTKKPPTL